MASYWPPAPQAVGPEVLFAWKDADEWAYAVGYGSWPLRGLPTDDGPTYWCRGHEIRPEHFAYIRPPEA